MEQDENLEAEEPASEKKSKKKKKRSSVAVNGEDEE